MTIRPNRVKRKLADGGIACVASGFTHPDDIDAFGHTGFDGVWLEGEHGPVNAADLGNLTRACDLWGMTSIVRVNRNDQALIYRTLDRGAQGIVVPHVNTAAEARNVVDGAKFAPLGKRGLFTSRQGYDVPDYLHAANGETLLVVLVEDIVAVRNLDAILKVDQIDVFFVAPSDLAASMGRIGDNDHPDVQRTVDETLIRIRDAGRTPGTLTTSGNVERYTDLGARFLLTTIGQWIAAGAADYLERARGQAVSGASTTDIHE